MAAKVQGVKTRRAAQMQEADVVDSVKGLSLDSVSKSITETQVEVQKVLAELSAKVMDRLQQLQDIEENIRIRQDDLLRLHDIEVKATTLDELEADITERKKANEEDQARFKRDFEEMKSDNRKQWKREEEEYQYRTSQEHKKQEDVLTTMFKDQEKQNKEKQEQLEKNWAERETELKKREQELTELRAFKDSNDERIKKEVNAQVAIATNSVKKEYETKMVLAAKDAETAQKLAAQESHSQQQNIAKQQEQITDLKHQLEQAHARVADISGKALDSASGRATTDALQRIMEKEQGSAKSSK